MAFPSLNGRHLLAEIPFLKSSDLGELLFAAYQSPNPFGQKGGVKWFAEGFVEQRAVETAGVVIVR